MPTATPKPLFIRYALLTLTSKDAVPIVKNFECSATEIAVTSEGGDVTSISTQCPAGSFSEVNPRTYSLTINSVQDVEDSDGLLWFSWLHEGETWEAEFYPKTDNQKVPVGNGMKGDVTISMPDTIGGGEPGNYATSELVYPYVGRPVLIDSAGVEVTLPPPAARNAEDTAATDDREPVAV